jgi:GTP 3',8-cyclase
MVSEAVGAPVTDTFRRPLRSLRVSVTDRCNLRCSYCMPEAHYTWLPKPSLLTFEETERLVRAFVANGVTKIRLTGGEPLLRRELPGLVARLAAVPGLDDLALTTNATRLAAMAPALKAAGLQRLTISLDTLVPERLLAHARSHEHAAVLEGIAAAATAGFRGTKINAVIMRGVNDDELVPLLAFAIAQGLEMRFIEYMDVGGATQWSADAVVSSDEMRARLSAHFGPITPVPRDDDPSAPAERFRLADGTIFGIIASTTRPFCRDCDRARLTADGTFFTCLYGTSGSDLRDRMRLGATDAELQTWIADVWKRRSDRGAEQRAQLARRTAQRGVDLHREMHVLGG